MTSPDSLPVLAETPLWTGLESHGSLAAWWNGRTADTPLFARTDLRRLPQDLDALARNGMALVVIDTPPALLDVITAAIAAADLVVIPCRPSPHDLRTVASSWPLPTGPDTACLRPQRGDRPQPFGRGGGGGPGDDGAGPEDHPLSTAALRQQHDRRPHRRRLDPRSTAA